MKYPVYWFLISSGLIASNSLSFAAPAEVVLPSSDSYNGNNSANTPFSPKETSNADGTNYNCTGDVCIANISTGLSKSCFTDSQGNLLFQGNGHALCFENINAGANNPAAINVSGGNKTLSINGFSSLSCSFCPPGTSGHGAIKSAGTTTLDNDSKLLFRKNCSTDNGGAISCKGLTLQNSSNSTTFIENSSAKHGGAIYSNSTTNISNNNYVTFTGNTTTGSSDSSGGAIYCSDTSNSPELKLEGNKSLIFSNNISGTSGGAVFAKKLTITSGGTTIFTNNSVSKDTDPKGGAICLDTSGECSFTADLGDIIFNGNTTTDTSSSGSTKRNAIDLGNNGKFTKLNAKDNFGIFFYDPITATGTADDLTINQTNGNSTYTGKIVFSGETLSHEEKIATNLKSSLAQKVTLSAGALILKDGVTLEAKSFTQTAGSAVIMDVGTTLQTPATDGDTITITDLSVNVASLGGGG
ncbi:Pmp family polymorphic membrane protein autotransporter adhesin, partial [Chlamydia sp. 26-15]